MILWIKIQCFSGEKNQCFYFKKTKDIFTGLIRHQKRKTSQWKVGIIKKKENRCFVEQNKQKLNIHQGSANLVGFFLLLLVSFVTFLCQPVNFCKCLLLQVIRLLRAPFILLLVVSFFALLYKSCWLNANFLRISSFYPLFSLKSTPVRFFFLYHSTETLFTRSWMASGFLKPMI